MGCLVIFTYRGLEVYSLNMISSHNVCSCFREVKGCLLNEEIITQDHCLVGVSCQANTFIWTTVGSERTYKVPFLGCGIWWMYHTGDLYTRPHVNIQYLPFVGLKQWLSLRKLGLPICPLLGCWTTPDWSLGSIMCLWWKWHGRCMVEVLCLAPLLCRGENHYDPNSPELKQCRTNQRQHIGKKNACKLHVLEDVLARRP